MRPETAISFVIAYLERLKGEVGYLEDIVDVVRKLTSGGVQIPGISIRPEPPGWTSDEVAGFVNKLVNTSILLQDSPIQIQEESLQFLLSNIQRAAEEEEGVREGLLKASEILNIDPGMILNEVAA